MSEWKDASSYSRSDKERIPNVWEFRKSGTCITIVRDHRHHDSWVAWMTGYVSIDVFRLKSTDLESAIDETTASVRSFLAGTLNELNGAG